MLVRNGTSLYRYSVSLRVHVTRFSMPRRLQPVNLCTSFTRQFSSSSIDHNAALFSPEYAFEMASSTVRFGRGVTKEVGSDMLALGVNRRVCVVTDPYMVTLPPMRATLDSLTKAGIEFDVFDAVSVEPTDESLAIAIEYCKQRDFAAFVAVGGGSVMDTAKAANVYMCNPHNEFLDFVNAPIGKGLPIPGQLKPLIAVPTTAGTGSETTGISIFDHTPTGAKTGIRDRKLRPTLGIIDPEHTEHCGPELTAFTGLDVLCHALESFTAVPYKQRIAGAPSTPQLRPAYQGSNAISHIWSGFALQQCAQYLPRAVADNDPFAREQMCLAATAAGVGFGNAGVHLCHAMSYPISSCVSNYRPTSGYNHALTPNSSKTSTNNEGNETMELQNASTKLKANLIPHGLSVILTAPAVFRWTAQSDLDKHLKAAELLGANVSCAKASDAGLILADTITSLLSNWKAFVPNGLKEVGYGSEHLDALVRGTLPQRKVIDVSPRQPSPDDFRALLDESMTLF